jgi:hypothetical protein
MTRLQSLIAARLRLRRYLSVTGAARTPATPANERLHSSVVARLQLRYRLATTAAAETHGTPVNKWNMRRGHVYLFIFFEYMLATAYLCSLCYSQHLLCLSYT